MSFPKFPDFKDFSITDSSAYLEYYSLLDTPYCDFSLDDTWLWLNFNNDLQVCELNNNLILKFTNVIDNDKPYCTFLGKTKLPETISTLMSYLTDQGLPPTLSYIPQQTVDTITKLNLPNINIEEDINNRDYVYNVDNLLRLEGKPYENLRRRINHFAKDKQNIHIKEFDLSDDDDQKIIKSTINKWSRRKDASRNDPGGWERNVINRHLKYANVLPFYAYGLYVDDTLVNINMFNLPPHKDWLIFNHIKCDYRYKDIYGYAFYNLGIIAKSKGMKWINFEQDLGIEGLKRIKTFFRPEKFLYRYTVSLDSDVKYQ